MGPSLRLILSSPLFPEKRTMALFCAEPAANLRGWQMRIVQVCLLVSFLSLFAATAVRVQSRSNQNTPPNDANTTAPPAALQDNPTTEDNDAVTRLRRTGVFGLVTVSLKAGDDAPNLEFRKVLHAPGTAQWNSSNAFNQTTALVFLPQPSLNPQQVEQWNELVDRFTGRAIQLVLITEEQESTLLPWLAQHPVSGWLLYDPTGATGKAYGLEMPNIVYVGADRRIIGFSEGFGFAPPDEELNAVLEGRTFLVPAPSPPGHLRGLANNGKMPLQAEPSRMFRVENNKPAFPPSYEVHIAPSAAQGTTSTSAPDYWSVGGFALKSIVAQAYGVDESRVDFRDAAAAGKRYDVALVLPKAEDNDAMMRRVQDALKKRFNLNIASEDRPMDVYVMTAPYGPGPELRPSDSMGGMIGASSNFILRKGQKPTPENMKAAMDRQVASGGITVGSISVSGGTIEDFCRQLETGLDRKVVDETHLTGHYDFEVARGDRTRDEFFDMLREQLGLAVTPEQRDVTMLVVRSNAAGDSALR